MEFQQGKDPVLPWFIAQVIATIVKLLLDGLPYICSFNWLYVACVHNGRAHLTSKVDHKIVSVIFKLKKTYSLTFCAVNSIKSQ